MLYSEIIQFIGFFYSDSSSCCYLTFSLFFLLLVTLYLRYNNNMNLDVLLFFVDSRLTFDFPKKADRLFAYIHILSFCICVIFVQCNSNKNVNRFHMIYALCTNFQFCRYNSSTIIFFCESKNVSNCFRISFDY